MSRAAARLAAARLALLAATTLLACSSGPVAAPVDEQNDVEHLQNALTEDPAQLVLEEVDQAIATGRPVIAADLIDRAAIPAVRRHVEAVQALDMTTSNGRTLRQRAGRLLRHRITALEHWRDALARGIGHDDEVLLDAIHANAEAEHEIFELIRELGMIRPLETRAPVEELPAIVPPAIPSDDDPQSPDPEPDPHAADPIDGREDDTVFPEVAEPEDHHAIVPR